MTPQFIIAAAIATASAASGFAGGWQVQSWRQDAKEAKSVKQALLETQQSAARDIRRADNIITAQNSAVLRERSLRADVARSRDAAGRLSDAADAALRRAQDTHAACIDESAKLKVVFLECSREYESVARDADLWENDAIKLQEAWPK